MGRAPGRRMAAAQGEEGEEWDKACGRTCTNLRSHAGKPGSVHAIVSPYFCSRISRMRDSAKCAHMASIFDSFDGSRRW